MKCLILAAGYATRLYPLTENFPKPLLKVREKAILDWLIEDIETCKLIEEYIVISNHKYLNHFKEWARDKKYKLTIIDDGTYTNDTRLGAVKDIQYATDSLRLSDDLLIIAGDNLLDFSLTRLIEYAKEKKTSCIMRFYQSDIEKLKKAGVACVDADDLIIDMEEKPKNPKCNWCTPPFYFLLEEDVKLIKKGIEEGCGTDAPGSFIAWLSKQVPVHAMLMPGNRYDIGDIISYEEVKREYKGIVI